MNQPPLDTPTPDSFSHSLRQSFLAGLLALLPLFITWKILALPNVPVCGGSWLTPSDAVATGDWGRITALARAAAALRPA